MYVETNEKAGRSTIIKLVGQNFRSVTGYVRLNKSCAYAVIFLGICKILNLFSTHGFICQVLSIEKFEKYFFRIEIKIFFKSFYLQSYYSNWNTPQWNNFFDSNTIRVIKVSLKLHWVDKCNS